HRLQRHLPVQQGLPPRERLQLLPPLPEPGGAQPCLVLVDVVLPAGPLRVDRRVAAGPPRPAGAVDLVVAKAVVVALVVPPLVEPAQVAEGVEVAELAEQPRLELPPGRGEMLDGLPEVVRLAVEVMVVEVGVL